MKAETAERLGERLFQRAEAARRQSPAQGLRLARLGEARLANGKGASRGQASTAWQRARLTRAAAHALRALGRHAEAERAYAAAARLFHRASDPVEAARSSIGRVDALMYLGRYDEAEREGASALRVLERGRQHEVAARLLNNLANLDYRRDRPERALARYARARPALAALGSAALGRVDANRANCLALRGRPEEAARLLRAARRAFERAALPIDAAACDYALAYLLFLRHRYIDALFALESLEPEFERLKAPDYLALLELDAAEVLLRLGRPEEAEESALRAAERAGSLGLRYEHSKAIYYAAVAAASRGDLDAARAELGRATRGFAAERNEVWVAQCRLALGECDLEVGRSRAAEAAATRAARDFARQGDAEREGLARVLAGRAALVGGRPASRHLALAGDASRRARSAYLAFRFACLAGDVAFRAGRPARARRAYARAARLSESLAGRVRTELFRGTDWTSWEDAYPRLVTLELAAGRTAEAFHALERGRARVFELASEGVRGRRRGSRLPARLTRRIEDLACRIESRRWRRAAGASLDGAPIVAAREERETARLLERLEREARRLDRARAPEPAGVQRVRRSIEPGEKLVEFFELDRSMHAVAIDRDGVVFHPGLADRATIEGWLEEITYLARAGVRGAERTAPAIASALREAAHRLVAPWMAGDPDLRRVTVVPAGRMAGLPWPSLVREATGRAIPTAAAPSASLRLELLARSQRPPRAGAVVLVGAGGERLPEVEREIEDIARRVPQARVLAGREATVPRLRRALAGADWLHVAGHGRADAERPILSGIRLGDRWAHVPDLAPAGAPRGVVLSACRSGELVGGWTNDWRGLAGSLLASGSHAVLASLWDTEDTGARRLISALYGRLASGEDLGTALAKCQEESMAEAGAAHIGWNTWTWGLFGESRTVGPRSLTNE